MQPDQIIQLDLLGRFRLHQTDRDIRLPAGKAMLVLAFLACARGRTAQRERLASLFWQESDVEQARASLRQALSRLRAALGDARDALWSDNDQIGLTQNYWSIDIDALLVCEAQQSAAINSSWAAPFLSGVHRRDPSIDAWLEGERQRLQQVVGRVFQMAIDKALSTGNADTALELGIQLNTLDPFAEPVHRNVMLAYEMKGDRASALRQYRTLVRILDEALGVAPDEETRALFERLRQHARPNKRAAVSRRDTSSVAAASQSAPQDFLHGSESTRATGDQRQSEQTATLTETPSGLRLVTVLALRYDNLTITERMKADIDTIARQQGGEPILSHGAESIYVFGLDGVQTSAAEAAFRSIRQVRDNTDARHRLACSCASGLVSFDENGHPIGAVVQRAARLALLADDGEFIIDRAVRAQMSAQVDVVEVNLRNQVNYQVVNLQFKRITTRHELIGRRVELAQLRQLLQDTETHGAAMAVVSGDAGMGKTHLMLSLDQLARKENCPVLRVAFSTHEASSLSLTAKLTRLLHDVLVDTGACLTFDTVQHATLNRLLATQREGTQQPLQDHEQQHSFDLLLTMIDRISPDSPTLVIAEDCHWADAADIELLIDLIDAQARRPVLLVVTERRENETVARVLQSRVTEVGVLSLTLTPLAKNDARALVASKVADEQKQARILNRAGGHPLFLTQLAFADLEPDTPVPDSIVALVQCELDRLSDRARVACLKAAILGPAFSLTTLQSIFPDIDSSDLLQSSLFMTQGKSLCFRHALVHEAVYALLSAEDTERLHYHAAVYFQSLNPGEYAHHALRSGDGQMAIDACATASNWLLLENRHTQAEHIVERGLQLKPEGDARARLLLSKMQVLRDRGELDAAVAACRQAHDCAIDAGLQVQALIRAATLLKRRNQLERAAAQLRQASQIADSQAVPDLILAELEHEQGNNMFMRGQAERCYQHHLRARQLAEQADDVRMMAAALGGLGDACYAGGKVKSANRYFRQCVELADSAGLHLIAIAHRPMLAFTVHLLNPGAGAIKLTLKAVDEAHQWKSASYEMLARGTAAEILSMALRTDESSAQVQRLRELESTFGGQRFEPDICYHETMQLWIHDNREAACTRAAEGVRDFGDDIYMGASLQAALAAVTDDKTVADKALGMGESQLSTGGLAHNRVAFAFLASACHWRRGNTRQALQIVERVQQQFGPEPLGQLDIYLQWMHAASGDNTVSLETAKAALEQHALGVLAFTHPPVRRTTGTRDQAAHPEILH